MASARYGHAHRAERKRWTPAVNRGEVECHATICLEDDDGRGRLIQPGTPWDLGHNTDGTAWTGPEHERCNSADGGRRSRRPAAPPPPRSRVW